MATDTSLALDVATKSLTAFDSFEEFDATCVRHLYVPTLRRDRLSVGRPGCERDREMALLRRALHEKGRRVWPAWGEYDDEQGAAAVAS